MDGKKRERLGETVVYLPVLVYLGTNTYASWMLQSCLSRAVNLTLAENYYVGMFFWTCRRAFTVQLVSLLFRRKRHCVAEIQPMQSWLKVAEVNSFSSCLHHHPVLETWKAEREPATQWTSLSPSAIAGLAYVSEILPCKCVVTTQWSQQS